MRCRTGLMSRTYMGSFIYHIINKLLDSLQKNDILKAQLRALLQLDILPEAIPLLNFTTCGHHLKCAVRYQNQHAFDYCLLENEA